MNNKRGFSLVELMVVVAIVGILTVIAYPSYQGFIKNSNRSAAQADLMSLGAAMERHKAASYSYKGAAQSSADTGKPNEFCMSMVTFGSSNVNPPLNQFLNIPTSIISFLIL